MFFYAAACIKTQIRFLDNDVTFVTICLLSSNSPVALVTVMLNVHRNHIRFFLWTRGIIGGCRHKYHFCRDKSFVATTKVCKIMFVVANICPFCVYVVIRDNKSTQKYAKLCL